MKNRGDQIFGSSLVGGSSSPQTVPCYGALRFKLHAKIVGTNSLKFLPVNKTLKKRTQNELKMRAESAFRGARLSGNMAILTNCNARPWQ